MTQHEIQRMLPRHFSILDLTLAGNGPAEIAQALGMTAQAVSLITKAPIFQHELAKRRDRVQAQTDAQLASIPMMARQLLEQQALQAVEVHKDIISQDENGDWKEADPQRRQASANAILDRVFGKGEQNSKPVVVLEAGAIQLLQLAFMESSKEL